MLQKSMVSKGVTEEISLKREKAKKQFDCGAKLLPDLDIGESVRMQPVDRHGVWRKGKVVKKVGNRSYFLETENGNVLKSNRKFLRTSDDQDMPGQDDQMLDIFLDGYNIHSKNVIDRVAEPI